MENVSSERPSAFSSLPRALQEVSASAQELLRSELKLAATEFNLTARTLTRKSFSGLLSVAFAFSGIIPFMAFLVIGLGKLLGENYWLSSLIVSVLVFSIGGFVAVRTVRKISEKDFMLPVTRQVFEENSDRASHGFSDVLATTKRGTA